PPPPAPDGAIGGCVTLELSVATFLPSAPRDLCGGSTAVSAAIKDRGYTCAFARRHRHGHDVDLACRRQLRVSADLASVSACRRLGICRIFSQSRLRACLDANLRHLRRTPRDLFLHSTELRRP